MHIDCGRMGDLDSIFVAEKEDVKALIGKNLYFGEVLGKHSEICGILEEEEVALITDDENVVKCVEDYSLNTGLNPLHYYTCNECGNIMDPKTALCDCEE